MEKIARPNRVKDLSGKRFGKLTVEAIHDRVITPCGSVKIRFLCRCDCGNATVTKRSNLVNGYTSSCGCNVREMLKKRNTTHGKTKTRTYRCWQNMKMRCLNPAAKHFDRYGGRGIRVCERWLKFENFLADMGEAPEGLTIERINNDGDYEPKNCRWASVSEQANNKSNTVRLTHRGFAMTLRDLSEQTGGNYHTLHHQIRRRGITVDEAIERNTRRKQ